MSDAGAHPPGLGGFGGVGDPSDSYDALAWSIRRLAEIRVNVEGDSLNMERCIKELLIIMIKITKQPGECLSRSR